MKAMMSMTIDTTWGNAVVLSVESELDNTHHLTTSELARLQVFSLSMMIAEVRRESERVSGLDADEPTVGDLQRAHTRFEDMERERKENDALAAARERERFGEMQSSHESDQRKEDVHRQADEPHHQEHIERRD